jgi:hypothetical protein
MLRHGQKMNGLFYDETGEFLTGFFYELYTPIDMDVAVFRAPFVSEWITSAVDSKTLVPFVYLEAEYRTEHACKLNPHHETDKEVVICS